jgi:hypothetical protein
VSWYFNVVVNVGRETDELSEILTINVGGQLFETSRDTLRKGDSMLSKMFSGKYSFTFDKQNNPFIDRDGNSFYHRTSHTSGSHFRIILNFLRSGKFVPPSDPTSLQELLIEVDYYQIKELSLILEKLIQKDRKVQYCKVLCNGDWIGQLNYLTEKGIKSISQY